MSDMYQFHPQLVLRVPRLPLASEPGAATINNLLQDTAFLESIYLASPVLYDECIKWREGRITFSKDIRKLKQSLLKYYSRMYSRSTPFGLFSGCAVVEWQEGPTAIHLEEKIERHTRFDMHYLCALASHLSGLPEIRKRLRFFPNNSLYTIGDEIRYIEYKYVRGKRMHQISSVSSSQQLHSIIQHGSKGMLLQELALLICDDEITEAEATAFVHEVVDAQLLVSELEPAITGKVFLFQILDVLEKINTDGNAEIIAITHLLEKAGNLLQQLDGHEKNEPSEYRQIMVLLEALGVPFEENKLFQVDVVRKAGRESRVNMHMQQQLRESLDVLNRLMPGGEHPNLQSFARRFYERYEEKEMPLLEVMDLETGIGYTEKTGTDTSPLIEDIILPGRKTDQKIAWGKLENFWKLKLTEAAKKNQYALEIKEGELDQFPASWHDLPPSLAVMFRIVDAEKNIISLQNAGGSSAANLLGRFAHADKHIDQLIQDVTATEQEKNEDVIFAEIIHLPESRVGNVLLHPAFRKYEIPYMAASSVAVENQITVQDLYVSVRSGRIILHSKRLGKEVVPRLSTAHNFSANALPVYQFLCDLQTQGLRNGVHFQWGGLAGQHDFFPRVQYKNTILHLATWNFLKKDVESLFQLSGQPLQTAVAGLRAMKNLPRFAVLADGDNELLVDFENEMMVQTWLDTVKSRNSFVLKEYIFTTGSGITDGRGNAYANQLVAVMTRQQQVYHPHAVPVKPNTVRRKFMPGSEWVYFKLYCGVKSADKILLEAVRPVTESLLAQGLIHKWFFIRYSDPDFHLRLRLEATDISATGKILQQMHAALSAFESMGFIWKVQLDTYNRELERYGTGTIQQAENIFYYDSLAMIDLLDHTGGDDREKVSWLWGIRAIDELLNCFELGLPEKLALLTELKNAFAKEFNMDKFLKIQLDNKHRSYKKQIEEIMDPSKDWQNELQPLILILKKKSDQMIPAARYIIASSKSNELEVPVPRLLGSYIHMLLNRLFTTSHRLHEMVMYDFLFRYYQSAVARQKLHFPAEGPGRNKMSV